MQTDVFLLIMGLMYIIVSRHIFLFCAGDSALPSAVAVSAEPHIAVVLRPGRSRGEE